MLLKQLPKDCKYQLSTIYHIIYTAFLRVHDILCAPEISCRAGFFTITSRWINFLAESLHYSNNKHIDIIATKYRILAANIYCQTCKIIFLHSCLFKCNVTTKN